MARAQAHEKVRCRDRYRDRYRRRLLRTNSFDTGTDPDSDSDLLFVAIFETGQIIRATQPGNLPVAPIIGLRRAGVLDRKLVLRSQHFAHDKFQGQYNQARFECPPRSRRMEHKQADERTEVYHDLHGRQLEAEEAHNRHSARVILGLLFETYMPQSVLDVGCGLGTWLSAAQELGVHDLMGVDGAWLNTALLRVPENLVRVLDLEKPFDLGRRFDLAVCLEVGEHLSQDAARGFTASLAKHADVLLFSAAIPFQGGHHHVNEQWPDYWSALFGKTGFVPLDFLRARIWTDNSVLWWLRQNTLLFVKESLLDHHKAFRTLRGQAPALSVVHPDVYLSRLRSAQAVIEEHKNLIGLLSTAGTFNVTRDANGRITITRA